MSASRFTVTKPETQPIGVVDNGENGNAAKDYGTAASDDIKVTVLDGNKPDSGKI